MSARRYAWVTTILLLAVFVVACGKKTRRHRRHLLPIHRQRRLRPRRHRLPLRLRSRLRRRHRPR